MLNISKISGLAGKALTVLKPTTRKVGMAAVFGAGALAGSLITQNSYRNATLSTQTEQTENNVKTESQSENNEKEFKYVPPKIGEDGIVNADTTYYAGTEQPEEIDYKDKDGRSAHIAEFDENGKMKGFKTFDNILADRGYLDEKSYNQKGELVEELSYNPDGLWYRGYEDNCFGWMNNYYDKNGNIKSSLYMDPHNHDVVEVEYTYHKDGSRTRKTSRECTVNNSMTHDKNGKLVEEKQYDDNGFLKYTVVPKYNKDGDLIENDTIRNNK